MTEAQKEYYLIEKGEFVELANVHTEGISPARIFDISVRVMARPYKSDAVLDELEKKMKSYFDTGYESEDLQFIEDCFKGFKSQQKER